MIKHLNAFALLAAAVSSPAFAEPTQSVTVTISRADIALSDKQLRHKLASAIEEVCGSYAAVESDQWRAVDDCRASAWSGAQQQLAELKSRETVKLGAR